MFSATCNSCLYVFTPFTFILNYSLMFVFLVLLKTVVSGRQGTTLVIWAAQHDPQHGIISGSPPMWVER